MGIALTWTVIYKILQPPDFQKEGVAPSAGSHGASPRSSDFGDFQVGGYEIEEFNPRSDNLKVVTSTLNEQKYYSSASALPSPSHQV